MATPERLQDREIVYADCDQFGEDDHLLENGTWRHQRRCPYEAWSELRRQDRGTVAPSRRMLERPSRA